MFALVINGMVVQVAAAQFSVAAGFLWVPIPSGQTVAAGDAYADGVFTPPAAPAPTLAQQAQALLTAGLAITSTGTPALNGNYAVQSGVPFGQQDIASEAQFISTYGEFTTGGASNLSWPLVDGNTMVVFPTTAEFLAFAKAAAQFVASVKLATLAGSALPTATATII